MAVEKSQIYHVLVDTPGIFAPDLGGPEIGREDLRTVCMAIGISTVTVVNMKNIDQHALAPIEKVMPAGCLRF